ncbi:MAG TPA: hypothetical protein PKW75_07260 [candidate division Zixibacteria bacterium]|nr:hypothetical protein [candidate division Zixibacteria bacterium]MDD4918803.1 hypothetical protein [candidate division Zixibacteria bacterium]MDM7973608.1 hypothetical protein [candidate division Zixibacteria bacterium]HOD65967.1 hypothetical protein [candidate division Zixibacteria bacterium]HOZ08069.1 hypothetical protein [candidate division Zixibacteria bacterium]
MTTLRFMSGACLRRAFLSAAVSALAAIAVPPAARAADPAGYVLSDVRVLYVSDDPERIDWPTLYYLNDEHGCRIDVVLLDERSSYRTAAAGLPERELYVHTLLLPPGDREAMDSATAMLFSERYPDIVLFEALRGQGGYNALRERILAAEPSADRRFNVLKIYEQVTDPNEALDSAAAVFLSRRELAVRYADRLAGEIPQLLGRDYRARAAAEPQLVRYRQVVGRVGSRTAEVNFLAGVPGNRLLAVLEELVADGPKKTTLLRLGRQYLASLNAALSASGRERAAAIVEGYRALSDLVAAAAGDPLYDAQVDLRVYFAELLAQTEELALRSVGVHWDGGITVRDSPDGPRLKFRASLSADGPQEVRFSNVRFHPYWDTAAVTLDTAARTVAPHQTFAREYLVEIDPRYLEAGRPDSLVFTAEIAFGSNPLTVRSAIPVGERADLDVRFEPDFCFVPPVADLDIDRVVAPLTLRVVIQKPREFAGTVKVNLETPRGLFAGAYRQEISLRKGSLRETVRIPFSISKLFELGLQQQVISLAYRDNVVAADTALVRIASCHVDDKTQVAFLPDTTGRLEDVLGMTDAAFRPLTDRGLATAPLEAYDVILVGSGAFRAYPSFAAMKDRFEDFVRNGGSLVIFGQPVDWPQDVLPVRFVPDVELVDRNDIINRIPDANLLSKPYPIVETNLLSSFYRKQDVAAAVVAPAERVYVAPSGAALLSVSRIGEGQIIYCGLPLLDMIARLDIDAIHLFANILNY